MLLTPFLAEAAQKLTPLQKIGAVSGQFWLKLILAIVALGIIIWLFRVLQGANKILLFIVTGAVIAMIGFNWIYERNEPEWATPIVNVLSQWFPTKDSYNGKQQQDPGAPGVKKNQPVTKPAPNTPTPNPAPAKK